MKSFLSLLLILSVQISFAQKDSLTVYLNDSINVIDLRKYTLLQSDLLESSTVSEINNKLWKYYPKGANFGISKHIYWLKYNFNNVNETSKKLVLYFPYHHIQKIEIFQVKNNHIKHIKSTGTYYAFDEKDIKSKGYPVFVDFPPGKSSVIIKLDNLYLPLRGASYLLSVPKMYEVNTKNESLLWLWRGVFLVVFFLSVILYLSTKIKLFLYYILYNVGATMVVAMDIGDFFLFFNSDPYNIIKDIKFLGEIPLLIFFPLFINQLSPISKLFPKFWKFMFYGIYIMPFLWVICIFPSVKQSLILYYSQAYFIFYAFFIFSVLLVLLFIAMFKKLKNSVSLFIIYLIYLSAVFFEILFPNIGMKKDSLLIYNILTYGFIFEVFSFIFLIGKETLGIYKERSLLLIKQKEHQNEIIKAIVESQEVERNKVGRELHDMIGANISVIKQNIDKSNKSLISLINKTVDAVRSLSHGLVTPLIGDDEFIDEINELALLYSTDILKINPHFYNWENIKNTNIATHLYRIVQELLQNAIKHSKATKITIQFLVNKKGELTLIYEDNGIGFDYNIISKKGLGIINIKNRVKLIKGKVKFDTIEGRIGTTIIINVSNIN